MKMLLISVPYIYAKTLFLSESRNRNVEVEEKHNGNVSDPADWHALHFGPKSEVI